MASPVQNNIQIALGVAGLQTVLNSFAHLEHGVHHLNAHIGETVREFAAPITAAIAAIASVENIVHVYHTATALEVLKEKTGVSIPVLVNFQKALDLGGSSAESAGPLLAHMEKSIYEVAVSGGVGEEAFKRLGLSFLDLVKANPTDQFRSIALGLSKIEDPTERTGVALKLLGKAGAEILPALHSGEFLKTLSGDAGTFELAMGRLGPRMHELHESIFEVGRMGPKLFAGILDAFPVEELAQKIKAVALSIDLTDLGQKLGAFVNVAVQAWKDGNLGELIALTIGAGFETGEEYAAKSWDAITEGIGRTNIAQLVWLGFMETMSRVFKATADGIANLITVLSASFNWLFAKVADGLTSIFDGLVNAWVKVINGLLGGVEVAINKLRELLSKVTGTAPEPFKVGISAKPYDGSPKNNLSFEDALSEVKAGSDIVRDSVKAWIDSGMEGIRKGVSEGAAGVSGHGVEEHGEPGALGGQGDARTRLASLIKEAQDKLNESTEKTHHVTESVTNAIGDQINKVSNLAATYERLVNIRRRQSELGEELVRVEKEQNSIESDFTMTESAKWERKKEALEKELAIKRELAQLERDQAANSLDENTRNQHNAAARGLDTQAGQVDLQIGKMGPDPNDFTQQWGNEWKKQLDQIGTFAQASARTLSGVFNAAFQGISSGLSGLVRGTMTWGDALRNIGSSVIDVVIQGIVKMFAAWIAGIWAKQAANTAASGIEAVGLGLVAMLTSITSYGWAAIAGVAAMGAAIAWAAGAFQEGGYTGPGADNKPAGIVHAGEYVIPANIVRGIGIAPFEEIRATGRLPASPDRISPAAQIRAGNIAGQLDGIRIEGSNLVQPTAARAARGALELGTAPGLQVYPVPMPHGIGTENSRVFSAETPANSIAIGSGPVGELRDRLAAAYRIPQLSGQVDRGTVTQFDQFGNGSPGARTPFTVLPENGNGYRSGVTVSQKPESAYGYRSGGFVTGATWPNWQFATMPGPAGAAQTREAAGPQSTHPTVPGSPATVLSGSGLPVRQFVPRGTFTPPPAAGVESLNQITATSDSIQSHVIAPQTSTHTQALVRNAVWMPASAPTAERSASTSERSAPTATSPAVGGTVGAGSSVGSSVALLASPALSSSSVGLPGLPGGTPKDGSDFTDTLSRVVAGVSSLAPSVHNFAPSTTQTGGFVHKIPPLVHFPETERGPRDFSEDFALSVPTVEEHSGPGAPRPIPAEPGSARSERVDPVHNFIVVDTDAAAERQASGRRGRKRFHKLAAESALDLGYGG